jgi:branched-chain amino acid aminotransferase
VSASQREVDLLRQVSRLESRVAELQSQLPPRVAPQKITNWEDLAFDIKPTNGHVRYTWSQKTEAWDAGQFIQDPYVNLHVHAGVLHYGITLFEGCKAFRSKDGKIRVCNLPANSARMNTGANRLVMPDVPESLFVEAVHWAVRANAEYVPPYGSGGSMYIRPFLMGSGPILGLQPCREFQLMVSVTPVGNYFGKGGLKGIHASVLTDFDRAAPHGTGDVKAGGNYAADLLPLKRAKEAGFGTTLYLDAKERKYIEEFSVSNFLGISSTGAYVTPASGSILPSITNQMLMQLARDRGLEVEQRPVEYAELPSFREVGACGTATVVAPVASITDPSGEKLEFHTFDILNQLRMRLQEVQYGEHEDRHGWMVEVTC